MNKFWKATLLNIIGIFLLTGLIAVFEGSGAFFYVPVIVSVLECLIALFLLIPDTTRRAAQVMLSAAGIVFLIGCGICSLFIY